MLGSRIHIILFLLNDSIQFLVSTWSIANLKNQGIRIFGQKLLLVRTNEFHQVLMKKLYVSQGMFEL